MKLDKKIKSTFLIISLGLLSFALTTSCGLNSPNRNVSKTKSGSSGVTLSFSGHLNNFGYVFNQIAGTPRDDVLQGTNGADEINGLGANDHIRGNDGNDLINGNAGADNINGNKGDDVVRGGRDDDTVRGGQGRDWVYGSKGNDKVYGDKGDDRLTGNEGNDYMDGGADNDQYYFTIGDGQDRIYESGVGGNDTLYCLGFHMKGKIGKSGNKTSIHFPTGDSIILENANEIENIVGCDSDPSGFKDNNARKEDGAAPGEKMANCKVIGGSLETLHESGKTKAQCESQCNSMTGNPQRKCMWDGGVFRDHPMNRCLIVGEGGKVKYDEYVRRNICVKQCISMEAGHPFRKCTWGNELYRDHR